MNELSTRIGKNNVLILKPEMMLSPSDLLSVQNLILQQIEEGVVIIPSGFSYEIMKPETTNSAIVIRCKECKKNATSECAMSNVYKPGKFHTWNGEDDFCSWGERESK